MKDAGAPLNQAEMRLPGSHRHVFQGDEGKMVDVDKARGRRKPLRVPMAAVHILERRNRLR